MLPVAGDDTGRHSHRGVAADSADEEPGGCRALHVGQPVRGTLPELVAEPCADNGGEGGFAEGGDEAAVCGARDVVERGDRNTAACARPSRPSTPGCPS